MSRGIGLFEAFQALPPAVDLVFAVLTQLADTWFVVALLAVAFVAAGNRGGRILGLSRRHLAVVFGLVLVGSSLSYLLKGVVALPRPPGAESFSVPTDVPPTLRPLVHWFGAADGFGFPSGHAITATVFYGGVAALGDWRTRTVRAAVATGLVAVVALSRLVLGVHYAVDVLAGIGLGLAVLGVVITILPRDEPLPLFGVAASVALAGIVLVGPTTDLVLTFAASVAAGVGWSALLRVRPDLVPASAP